MNVFRKSYYWFDDARVAIMQAGGVPDVIIDKFPVDLLEILIRNDIHLVYRKSPD